MKQLMTVFKFEYITFVKSRSFVVMTVILILAAMLLPSIPTLQNLSGSGQLSLGDDEIKRMAIIDATGHFNETVCRQYLPEYDFIFFSHPEEGRNAVSDGTTLFAAEVVDFNVTLYVPAMKLSYYNTLDQVVNMVKNEYQYIGMLDSGLDEAQASALLRYSPKREIVTVSSPSGDNAGDYQENMIYAYFMIIILYISQVSYGQYILTSVIREKTTKTMELLVTSCPSARLINGKVLGVGLAGLTQLSATVIAALASMYVNSQWQAGLEDAFTVAVKPGIITCMVVFFLLGFFIFAYMYAALASTVSRMEDANNVATLPMVIIMAAFIASMVGMLTPGAVWVTVLSYVPFFTPMVMFMRICIGAAAIWETGLSIAIQLASIVLVGWLAAKIYRMGTLMYGKQLNINDILVLIKK